jgi:hypothetical protein
MNPKTIWQAIGVVASLGIVQASAQAAVVVVDTVAAPIANANAVASGRVVDGVVDVANWTLTATVNNNNFNNVGVQGGSLGLEYNMTNTVGGSTATNTVGFTVNPLAGYDATGLTVSQSPYNNTSGTWNGGTNGTGFLVAQFVLNWVGGGFATVADPADQLAGLSTGSLIASGTLVTFSSGQIFNNLDSWRISIPGTASAQVVWSAVQPINNRRLNNEWVAFDPSIVKKQPPPQPVPVPGTFLLLAGGLFALRRFAHGG